MLTQTEFCSNLIATQEFCFVSEMGGDLLGATQLRRGVYRPTNFCTIISSSLSRITDKPVSQIDRPNSNFFDQKGTPVKESVQYL